MTAKAHQIIAGGDPEQHFARLEINPTRTFDGAHPWGGERWTAWELSGEDFGRLAADVEEPDLWTPTESWWRECGGSNLGTSADGDTTINGHRLDCWNCREREDDDAGDGEGDLYAIENQSWKHVFEYLCEHVGASTERNVSACLTDLAKMNDMSVGALLTLTVPSPAPTP